MRKQIKCLSKPYFYDEMENLNPNRRVPITEVMKPARDYCQKSVMEYYDYKGLGAFDRFNRQYRRRSNQTDDERKCRHEFNELFHTYCYSHVWDQIKRRMFQNFGVSCIANLPVDQINKANEFCIKLIDMVAAEMYEEIESFKQRWVIRCSMLGYNDDDLYVISREKYEKIQEEEKNGNRSKGPFERKK